MVSLNTRELQVDGKKQSENHLQLISCGERGDVFENVHCPGTGRQQRFFTKCQGQNIRQGFLCPSQQIAFLTILIFLHVLQTFRDIRDCKHWGRAASLRETFCCHGEAQTFHPPPLPPATSSSFDLENLRWSHLSIFRRIYYREWDPPRVHLPPPSLKTLRVFFLWTCHSQLALRHLPCLTPPLLAHTHSHNLHPRDDSNIQRRLAKQAAFLKIASAVIKAISCYINGGAQCKRKIWNHLFTKQEHGAIRGTKNKALLFLPWSLPLGLSWSFVFAI